ncbi:MAG: MurR/RpiR family transcriptional regulator [Bosea sp. (in: a-proteobacteria)]
MLGTGSPGHRKLAEFILRHPIRVCALSIEELARVTQVSAPTISRFARELDLSGFAEMRSGVAEAIQALLDPVEKLRLHLAADRSNGRGGDIFRAVQSQINHMDVGLIGPQIDEIASLLMKARQIHIMGFGMSAHVAGLLVLGLQPFCAHVSGVVEFGGTEVAAGRLMGIGPQDALIAITFPRYASDVVNLARYARDRGAQIIALTDSPLSPIAALAHHQLYAPAEHPTLSSSMVAAIAIAEALVGTVMLSDPANAEKATLLGDAIGNYLHMGS